MTDDNCLATFFAIGWAIIALINIVTNQPIDSNVVLLILSLLVFLTIIGDPE